MDGPGQIGTEDKNPLAQNDRRAHRIALLVTVCLHLLIAGGAVLYILDDPEKGNIPQEIEIEITSIPSQTILPPIQDEPETQSRTMKRAAKNKTNRRAIERDVVHDIPVPDEVQPLEDLPVQEHQVFHQKITQSLEEEMSQEDAFDSLMVYLKEYPEYAPEILRKMVAGKDIQRIPDLTISTGIAALLRDQKYKTKYEYESTRQNFLYGTYRDPVLGPRGAQQLGMQVNFIELFRWVRELVTKDEK